MRYQLLSLFWPFVFRITFTVVYLCSCCSVTEPTRMAAQTSAISFCWPVNLSMGRDSTMDKGPENRDEW